VASINVSIDGIEGLAGKLAKLAGTLEANARRVVEEEAAAVESDAKFFVPVDQGELQDAITVELDGLAAAIGPRDSSVFYGIWIEFGRQSAPAQPFMAPAAELSRNRFADRVTRELGQVARDV
jgi:HK97 gp10 family phage protein